MLTYKALAGILTWILTAGLLFYLYYRWMYHSKSPRVSVKSDKRDTYRAGAVELEEKTKQGASGWTSIFKDRNSGNTRTAFFRGRKTKDTGTSTSNV
jgi:hypothetical protein